MARLEGKEPAKENTDYPHVEEGVRMMAFIDNVVASAQSDQKWYDFKI